MKYIDAPEILSEYFCGNSFNTLSVDKKLEVAQALQAAALANAEQFADQIIASPNNPETWAQGIASTAARPAP